jgi:hypothetical protein
MRFSMIGCAGSSRAGGPRMRLGGRDRASRSRSGGPSAEQGGVLGLDQMVARQAHTPGSCPAQGGRRRSAEIRAGSPSFSLICEIGSEASLLAALEPGRCRRGPAEGCAPKGFRGNGMLPALSETRTKANWRKLLAFGHCGRPTPAGGGIIECGAFARGYDAHDP